MRRLEYFQERIKIVNKFQKQCFLSNIIRKYKFCCWLITKKNLFFQFFVRKSSRDSKRKLPESLNSLKPNLDEIFEFSVFSPDFSVAAPKKSGFGLRSHLLLTLFIKPISSQNVYTCLENLTNLQIEEDACKQRKCETANERSNDSKQTSINKGVFIR